MGLRLIVMSNLTRRIKECPAIKRTPNAFLWEKDTIWVGYRLRSGQSEDLLPTLAKYGFIYEARVLGRKAGGSLLVLLNFETDDSKKLFLDAIREERVVVETFTPTQFDIEHAHLLGES